MNNLIEAPEVPQSTVEDLVKAWLDGYVLKFYNNTTFDKTEPRIPDIDQYEIDAGRWKVYKKVDWWESKDLKFPFLARVNSHAKQLAVVLDRQDDEFITNDVTVFHRGTMLIPLTDKEIDELKRGF